LEEACRLGDCWVPKKHLTGFSERRLPLSGIYSTRRVGGVKRKLSEVEGLTGEQARCSCDGLRQDSGKSIFFDKAPQSALAESCPFEAQNVTERAFRQRCTFGGDDGNDSAIRELLVQSDAMFAASRNTVAILFKKLDIEDCRRNGRGPRTAGGEAHCCLQGYRVGQMRPPAPCSA
jgi:hypothetical protein